MQVTNQNKSSSSKNQGDDQRLEKVLPESPEESFCSSVIISFYRSQHTVVKSCQRGTDGDDRNTAKNKKKIRDDDITQFIEKNMNWVVFV